MNKGSFSRWFSVFFLATAVFLWPMQSSWAFFESLTPEKERQVGEEFFLELQQVYPIVEDPFLTAYINRLGQRLVATLGPQPFNYRFFIVEDPSINAFAVPGGYIFVTTGMLRLMDHEGELAGVLAHEISHIYCRHMAKQLEKSKVISVASLIAGLAAVFLGGGALAQPLLVGSMAAGESAMLKYSRDAEREADATGFKWMISAGYNPRDMVSIFKKMNRQRWFEGGKVPVYLSTHPDVDNRIVDLGHQFALYQDKIPPAPPDNPEFQYFAVKLESLEGNPNQVLRRMTQECLREPQKAVYPYGKALALAKLERSDEAIIAFQQALKLDPRNDIILRDLAIHYFSRNRYLDAQKILEDLSRRRPHDATVLYYLGRIHQERRQFDQALPLFEKVHKLNPTFIEVYYNLGTTYGEKGQLGPAHYYLAFHSLKARAYPTAMFHFQKALQNLSASDPRYSEVRRQVARLQKMKVRVQ